MPLDMEDKQDALLQLKKRARRRLVGAAFLMGSAALVLNMAMDHQPKQETQEIEIRIPSPDGKPFAPRLAEVPPSVVPSLPTRAPTPASKPESVPSPTLVPKLDAVPVLQPRQPAVSQQKVVSPADSSVKPVEKTPPRMAVEKGEAKDSSAEARRAAAILSGKSPESPAAEAAHVILIGAFSNPGNVKNLQSKLGQLGIKVYTEPLDTPQGKKIRVRAGPFPTREAGDKALEKMKRIGVNGVLTAQ